MKPGLIGIASGVSALLWASVAVASPYTSTYSDLDLGKCALIEEESEIGFVQVKCDGQYGYDVYATEGDLRLYLAYRKPGDPLIIEEEPAETDEVDAASNGSDADVEDGQVVAEALETPADSAHADEVEQVDVFVPVGVRPIGQTLAPFNNLGPKLEWRASQQAGAEPFATIVRYSYQRTDEDGSYSRGSVLVVSRFRNGDSCHVAYIDAKENADANVMAREVADKYASGGECPEGRVPVVGRGAWDFR